MTLRIGWNGRRMIKAPKDHWNAGNCRQLDSICALPLHTQVRIEELQRGITDMVVPPGAIDAGSIDAGLRPGVASQVIALVDEDLMVDLAGHHVETHVRNVFGREFRILLGRSLGVPRADDDVRRDCKLP